MTAVDTFARWHVASGDIDPVYPVLGHLGSILGLDPEDHLALGVLYVAYYDLGSALTAWLDGWRPGKPLTDVQLRYRTGVERRAHRDVRQFERHIASVNAICEHYGGMIPWLCGSTWAAVQQRIAQVHGNGRWAGYKLGEILSTVYGNGAPPPDAGHAHSSGPRKGLADIYPETARVTGHDPASIRQLDRMTDMLVARWGLPVAQVETVLCDWHSTVNGHYYVGHDIDLMLDQVGRAAPAAGEAIMTARALSFDDRWLGEMSGWPGVRKRLLALYQVHRQIEWWA